MRRLGLVQIRVTESQASTVCVELTSGSRHPWSRSRSKSRSHGCVLLLPPAPAPALIRGNGKGPRLLPKKMGRIERGRRLRQRPHLTHCLPNGCGDLRQPTNGSRDSASHSALADVLGLWETSPALLPQSNDD